MTSRSSASGQLGKEAGRRAFYLLKPGAWRDYVNILHLPYTIWHLSYVVLGAALVYKPDYSLLLWTLLAFFLAMGLGAHVLDERRSRPLNTSIPDVVLVVIGLLAVSAAALIGVVVGLRATLWILPFLVAGAWLVLAYNLEWGPFHHSLIFALAWGAFPVLTSYVAQTGQLSPGVTLLAAGAALLSYAQRVLSRRVRHLRREVIATAGFLETKNGAKEAITATWLVKDDDRALLVLSVATPTLALGLLLR